MNTQPLVAVLMLTLIYLIGDANAAGILAPMQLTNPDVAVTVQGPAAAWVVDENLGVLYCTTVNDAAGVALRVSCIDSNGLVEAAGSGRDAFPQSRDAR